MNITAGADRAAHRGVKEMILGTNEHDVTMSSVHASHIFMAFSFMLFPIY